MHRRTFVAGVGTTALAGCLHDPLRRRDPDPAGDSGVRWERAPGGSLWTVHGDAVYALEDFQEGRGSVLSLDRTTGADNWRYGESGGYTSYSRPAVDDGAIYFGSNDDAIGSGSGTLYAITHAGDERWTTDTGSVYDRPIRHRGTLHLGSDDGRLYAIDPATGDERWSLSRHAADRPHVPEVLTAVDDVVYVDDEGQILAVSTDGEERWTYETGEEYLSTAVVGHNVYFSAGETLGRVSDGDLGWSREIDGRLLSVSGDTVYTRHDGRLAARDPDDGTERWSVTGATETDIHDDGVIVGSRSRSGPHLVRSVTRSGDVEWTADVDGLERDGGTDGDLSSVHASGDAVYVVTDGGIHRLDAGGRLADRVSIAGVRSTLFGAATYAATSDRFVELAL